MLACFNAAGSYCPPYIIFKGQKLRNVGLQGFEEATYSVSQKGWMMKDTFYAWLGEFNNFVVDAKIPKPVVLFMDGHSSHISLETGKFASDNGIILYCLPPHASHIVQPLDVGFFSALKAAWHNALLNWQWEHPGVNFTKGEFPALFKTVWVKGCSVEKAAASFKRAGLFPLDPTAIDTTRLVSENISPLDDSGRTEEDVSAADLTPHVKALSPNCSNSFVPDAVSAETSIFTAPGPDLSHLYAPYEDVDADAIESEYAMYMESPSDEFELHQSPVTGPVAGPSSRPDSPPTATKPDIWIATSPVDAICPPSSPPQLLTSTPLRDTSSKTVEKLPSTYVSKAFRHLQPPVPKKRAVGRGRSMPKAVSGREALGILQEVQETKRRDEVEKLKRKLEREEKKNKKIAEKEKKTSEKALKKKGGACRKKQKVVKFSSSEGDTDTETELPNLDESVEDVSYNEINQEKCLVCESTSGKAEDWVGCDMCPRWTHIQCTRDSALQDMKEEGDIDGIKIYPFTCIYCDFYKCNISQAVII